MCLKSSIPLQPPQQREPSKNGTLRGLLYLLLFFGGLPWCLLIWGRTSDGCAFDLLSFFAYKGEVVSQTEGNSPEDAPEVPLTQTNIAPNGPRNGRLGSIYRIGQLGELPWPEGVYLSLLAGLHHRFLPVIGLRKCRDSGCFFPHASACWREFPTGNRPLPTGIIPPSKRSICLRICCGFPCWVKKCSNSSLLDICLFFPGAFTKCKKQPLNIYIYI